MFIPPAITWEVARQRQRDFVAHADSYRLSRHVSEPSTLWGWRNLRASFLRWRHLDDHKSLDDSEEGLILAAGHLTA